MSNIALTLYIFAIIGMFIKCVKLIHERKMRSLIIGLALTFWIVPDFMIFNYWGIHISFVFILFFSYALPMLEAIQLKTFRFNRIEFSYILFLFLVLIYAFLTPVLKNSVREYYGSKLGEYLYSLLLFIIIFCTYMYEATELVDNYVDLIILAMLAYAFKNFYMAGFMNFRVTYELNVQDLKNIIFASRILGLGSILALYRLVKTKKFIYIIPTLILLGQMLMCESRGTLVAISLALLYMFFLTKGKNKKINIRRINLKSALLIFVMLAAVIYGGKYLYDNGFFHRFQYKWEYFRMGKQEDRNILYVDLLTALKNHFPFGIGFGGTQNALYEVGSIVSYNYPHNLLLEIFLEEGSILGIYFLLIMVKTVIRCGKINLHSQSILWATLFIYSLVNSMFSGDITGNAWLFVLGLLISSLHLKNISKFDLSLAKLQEQG